MIEGDANGRGFQYPIISRWTRRVSISTWTRDIAARSLDTKRTVITKLMSAGLYPYTKRYLGALDNHFSTIGLSELTKLG